jgi:hypothetical protein
LFLVIEDIEKMRIVSCYDVVVRGYDLYLYIKNKRKEGLGAASEREESIERVCRVDR